MPSVTVRAPAKLNLALSVGAPSADGFHPVATIYHAVDLYELVRAEPADLLSLEVSGPGAADVPTDETNLAARAALLLAGRLSRPAAVHLAIRKAVPVAGGMAGGSADAAAALVACNALWGSPLSRDALLELAAELGSDVPFSLVGGTALGTGRGDRLEPVPVDGRTHWVLAVAAGGLSTAAVYARLDELRRATDVPEPTVDGAVVAALAAGDPSRLGAALSNDLQLAALDLQPSLRATLQAGRAAGALGAVVSGSGPTCAFLAQDDRHALELAVTLAAAGTCGAVVRAAGPAEGAAIVADH